MSLLGLPRCLKLRKKVGRPREDGLEPEVGLAGGVSNNSAYFERLTEEFMGGSSVTTGKLRFGIVSVF